MQKHLTIALLFAGALLISAFLLQNTTHAAYVFFGIIALYFVAEGIIITKK